MLNTKDAMDLLSDEVTSAKADPVTSEDFEEVVIEVGGEEYTFPVPSEALVQRFEKTEDPLNEPRSDELVILIPENNPLVIKEALEEFKRNNDIQELSPHDWSTFTIGIIRSFGPGTGIVNTEAKIWGLRSPAWFVLNAITGGVGLGLAIVGHSLYKRIKADPSNVKREDIESYLKAYKVFRGLRDYGLEPLGLFSLHFSMCLTMISILYGAEALGELDWHSKLLCTLISFALTAPNMYMHYRSRQGNEAPTWARTGAEAIKGFSAISSLNRILVILNRLNPVWLALTWQSGLALVGGVSQLLTGPKMLVDIVKGLLTLAVDTGLSAYFYDFIITITSLITNAIRNDNYYVDNPTLITVGVVVGALLSAIQVQRGYNYYRDYRENVNIQALAASMNRDGPLANQNNNNNEPDSETTYLLQGAPAPLN